jgi:chromate reductase, NAD(P)H dehydrogenase (quinone)
LNLPMVDKHNIFVICGSTRKNSSNHQLIETIGKLYAVDFSFHLFDALEEIPAFNPDAEAVASPPAVVRFRRQIQQADGVMICTPEYAHGVPGALKNALDYTVGSGDFSGKPTVLITASTDGRFGHAALLEVLRVIECKNIDQLQLLIPFIKTKLGAGWQITDDSTRLAVEELMRNFKLIINASQRD